MTENKEFQEKIKELMSSSEFLHYFHNTIEINYAVFFILFSVVWSMERNEGNNEDNLKLLYPVNGKGFGTEFEIVSFRIVTNESGYGNVIFTDNNGHELSMELISALYLMEASFSALSNYSGEKLDFLIKNIEGNVDRFLNERSQHDHEHGEGCGCGHDHNHEDCDCEEGHECGCGHNHG
ncbi:hypothetical protein [Sebaldella sp. S0638]|uniref:hypothetical protein n=1 Tax=Sebaldella sp. S0638 TaxID=2957809 RepID=UPI00209D377D|nr:hypothetical protein [Sebaldella sp. S0638]MCP1225941.1 hypothetical protein [Sebaldella sp. S0638]